MNAAGATTDTNAPFDWRGVGLSAILALPTAVVMTAAAGLVVALAAFPVALAQTHDRYLALLAVSYGPFAAATVLQGCLGACLAWALLRQVGTLLPRGVPRFVASVMGGLAVAELGLLFAKISLLGFFAVPWRNGPALPLTGANFGIAALAGSVAGVAAWWHAQRIDRATTLASQRSGHEQMRQAIGVSAWFALPLALVLVSWAAVLAAMGQI